MKRGKREGGMESEVVKVKGRRVRRKEKEAVIRQYGETESDKKKINAWKQWVRETCIRFKYRTLLVPFRPMLIRAYDRIAWRVWIKRGRFGRNSCIA